MTKLDIVREWRNGKMEKWNRMIPSIILVVIIFIGFCFRIQGIVKNLSFWNDEGHAAYFSRAILEKGVPITQTGQHTGLYQVALYYCTAIFFKIFGISEFAGRLPSVLVGTLLIAVVYILAKKLTNTYTAYIAGFLTAFSQIQLAWSTQLRPYIWLELCSVLIAYFSYKYLQNKKSIIDTHLLYAFLLSCVASLFHGTGLVNFVLISGVFIYKIVARKKYHYILLLVPTCIIIVGLLYFSLSPINRNMEMLLKINTDLLHYRVFLQANYWWLLLGAFIGSIPIIRLSKEQALVLCGFPIIIFILAVFKFNAQYVRYSLPAFPFLYILFGNGVIFLSSTVGSVIKHEYSKKLVFGLIIIGTLWQTTRTNKVLAFPRYYYTINGDMRENPIVDYKTAFQKIKTLTAGYTNVIVMDAWNDRVPWYLPNQKYIFLIEHRPAKIDPVFGESMITTRSEFLAAQKQYKSGVVLVENWESQTAYSLQQYIRNHLKHEFDVQNLPYNEEDKWSISIYSWGI